MKTKLTLALFVLSAFLGSRCFGYALGGTYWTPNRTVVMHLSLPTTGGPYIDGSASLSASAEDALNIWNQSLFHMRFVVDRESLLEPSGTDGDTSVSMASSFYGGFIVQGSQPATVVLRALGNSLHALGLANTLSDPLMELHDSKGNIVQTSDDWISNPDPSATAIYHLDPRNSREPAILATLNPGSYTFVVQSYDNGDGNVTGTTVIELYDLHTTGGRAGNISSRGQVIGGNDILIGGFIVGGSQPKEVVVRALGPSLATSNVANPLSDPTLELRDAAGNLVDSNDNWGNHAKAAQIQSEGFAPPRSAESALQDTLPPGNFTAIVRGAGSASGIGLVEIYDLSPPPN